MTDRWLIAHKVRGEAAFDVATQIECAECATWQNRDQFTYCSECNDLKYWWIIPTSGHRAYPWWSMEFYDIFTEHEFKDYGGCHCKSIQQSAGDMPDDLPDHYTTRAEPKAPKRNLLAEIGLAKPAGMVGTLKRRI